MAQITLKNINKIFPDGTRALNNINFNINDGEFFILVGPSGCGKSTLLNAIVGLEEISAGEILVDGKQINDLDPKDRNMAMVFQSYALYPHMSVRENIAFPLTMAKLPKEEIKRRVAEAAEILELEDLLERKPKQLSGGQRQRVAMGRAIVRQPVAFLLDEPLSNLDARLRVQMRTEILRLQKRLKTTTIYVTHDQTEAMTLGDRVAVMKEGVVQQLGTPLELYNKPENLFVASFIGSPAMNFFPAKIRNNHLLIPAYHIDKPLPDRVNLPDNDEILAGIRPEHLHIAPNNDKQSELLSFTVTVDIVEWPGADTMIYFQNSDKKSAMMAARIDGSHSVNENDSLALYFDLDQLHLFHSSTSERLL